MTPLYYKQIWDIRPPHENRVRLLVDWVGKKNSEHGHVNRAPVVKPWRSRVKFSAKKPERWMRGGRPAPRTRPKARGRPRRPAWGDNSHRFALSKYQKSRLGLAESQKSRFDPLEYQESELAKYRSFGLKLPPSKSRFAIPEYEPLAQYILPETI